MNKLLFFCLSVTECPLILLLLGNEDSNAHGRVDATEALLEPPCDVIEVTQRRRRVNGPGSRSLNAMNGMSDSTGMRDKNPVASILGSGAYQPQRRVRRPKTLIRLGQRRFG